ncbi:hypothetical protein ACLOJK_008531 [Asimina triloba]
MKDLWTLSLKQVKALGRFFTFCFLWGFFQWFYTAADECGFRQFPTFGLEAHKNMSYLDFSTTYVGVGMICPYIVNTSLLVGSILSWGIMWPLIATRKGDWYPASESSSSLHGDGLYNFFKVMSKTVSAFIQQLRKGDYILIPIADCPSPCHILVAIMAYFIFGDSAILWRSYWGSSHNGGAAIFCYMGITKEKDILNRDKHSLGKQTIGGTFALYSLLCRHADIGFLPYKNVDSNSGLSNARQCNDTHKQSWLGKFLAQSFVARRVLLFVAMLGMCMLIGDGILTPAISVLSAIDGLRGSINLLLKRLVQGGPLLKYEGDSYARIGVMPRYGNADSIKGDVPKAIQCYMHENGISESAAREVVAVVSTSSETWKKLNEVRLNCTSFCGSYIEAVMNTARSSHYVYQFGVGSGAPGNETEDRLMGLLVQAWKTVRR